MKTSHIIIGAAAIAAVGLYVYSTRSKAPTAAVKKATTKPHAPAVLVSLKDYATKLGISSPSVAVDVDSELDGDIVTARASDAQLEIQYSLA